MGVWGGGGEKVNEGVRKNRVVSLRCHQVSQQLLCHTLFSDKSLLCPGAFYKSSYSQMCGYLSFPMTPLLAFLVPCTLSLTFLSRACLPHRNMQSIHYQVSCSKIMTLGVPKLPHGTQQRRDFTQSPLLKLIHRPKGAMLQAGAV